jgi:hypothetical protein
MLTREFSKTKIAVCLHDGKYSHYESRLPVLPDKIIGVIWQLFGSLPVLVRQRILQGRRQTEKYEERWGTGMAYKVPAVVVQRGDLGLKVDAVLALHHVVVSQALVPGGVLENALAVHVDPGLLEANDTACGKVDTAVVEIVADGNLGSESARDSKGILNPIRPIWMTEAIA